MPDREENKWEENQMRGMNGEVRRIMTVVEVEMGIEGGT
jgi:hypothetical protein